MVVLWGGGRILLSEVPLCWAYSNPEQLKGPQVVPGRTGRLPTTLEWSMTHFDVFLKVNSLRFVGKLTSKVNSRPESGQ